LVEEDYPYHYDDSFTALTTTITCLLLPDWICTPLITFAASKLIDGGTKPFLSEHYLPELTAALKPI